LNILHHDIELKIPKKYKRNPELGLEFMGRAINIEIVALNGGISLRIGRYNHKSSPQKIEKIYRRFVEITNFPLLYVGIMNDLAPHFLGISLDATKDKVLKESNKEYEEIILSIKHYKNIFFDDQKNFRESCKFIEELSQVKMEENKFKDEGNYLYSSEFMYVAVEANESPSEYELAQYFSEYSEYQL